ARNTTSAFPEAVTVLTHSTVKLGVLTSCLGLSTRRVLIGRTGIRLEVLPRIVGLLLGRGKTFLLGLATIVSVFPGSALVTLPPTVAVGSTSTLSKKCSLMADSKPLAATSLTVFGVRSGLLLADMVDLVGT